MSAVRFVGVSGLFHPKLQKKQSAYLQTTDQPFGRGVWELYIS